MPVRQLSEGIVNRIAAGEVVERPASVVKELVENALDAGATRIEIVTDGGGRRSIRVSDDGAGMTRDDLALAVERHATSKLPNDDLLDIRTLGSRGEALPSIGAVARLTITTRHAGEPHGWAITVGGGRKAQVKPGPLGEGTRVEVRDLFYATPARLKFLKSDRSEGEAIREVVRRLAMSRPDVAFTLAGEERAPVTWAAALPGASGRLARLSARPISLRQRPPGARQAPDRRGARRLCRLSAARPPSDRGAVRHPRSARGRRQRASGQGRGALPREGQRAATTGGSATVAAFRPAALPRRGTWDWRHSPARPIDARGVALAARGHGAAGLAEAAQAAFDVGGPAADARVDPRVDAAEPDLLDRPLGAARAQVQETYIVA